MSKQTKVKRIRDRRISKRTIKKHVKTQPIKQPIKIKPKQSIKQSTTQPKQSQAKTQAKTTSWDDLFDILDDVSTVVNDTNACKNSNDKLLNKYLHLDYKQHDTLSLNLDEESSFECVKKSNTCIACNTELYKSGSILVCSNCGMESESTSNLTEEAYSSSALTECNINDKGFIPIKMVGSYGCQRSLLKICSNYKKYRTNNNLKDMKEWNTQSTKHRIPKNVIKEANEMFEQIKDHGFVFRKDVKKGVLSACLYYACYNNNISKTPAEIAHFSGIDEKFHSAGDRKLRDLNEKGIIHIPIKVDPISDYIDRYLTILKIDKKYKKFLIDLIAKAEEKKIHMIHDSKHTTKCVGAIYMLVDRVPKLKKTISVEQIEKECDISKTTFIRYYTILGKYSNQLKNVFKKHKIPMKNTWRTKRKKIIIK